ncbi:MAG: ATP-binding protein [Bdellovibrionota bacterium]
MEKKEESEHYEIVGRARETQLLSDVFSSKEPEFVVMYGRRRIGKTYLIKNLFKKLVKKDFFIVTGKYNASKQEQLTLFQESLEKTFYAGSRLSGITSWEEGFRLLCAGVETTIKNKPNERIVLFFDEISWLSQPKSGFLENLEFAWNHYFVNHHQIKLIVCGSAAYWILEKLIYAKGGLHNRITRQIRLAPFSLKETHDYFHYRGLKWKHIQTMEAYFAVGGVPQYLKQFEKKYSVAQNIGKYAFEQGGFLRDEYQKLFSSLFDESKEYYKITEAIAEKRQGINREEIIQKTKISSGGTLNKKLKELEETGFIVSFTPYHKKTKDTYYRICDEFILFHLKWIATSPKNTLLSHGDDYWLGKTQSQSYISWSGYTFENICLKHIIQIKHALKIRAIPTEAGVWNYFPDKTEKEKTGVQIDLLLDREDDIITIVEIKYYNKKFIVSKELFKELQRKIDVFQERTKTKKHIQVALITPYGITENIYSKEIISQVLTLEDLFVF